MQFAQGIFQAHIRLARAGKTIDSVLVGENTPPDFTPTSNWQKISESIATFSQMPERGNAVDVMKTVGGRRIKSRVIYPGPASLKITIETHDNTEIVDELLSLSDEIDTSAATTVASYASFVPLSKTTGGIKGWFHIQQYDDNDEISKIQLLWGELTIDSDVKDGDDLRKPTLVLTAYYNALNEGRRYVTSTTEIGG